DLFDFAQRVDARRVNKGVFESLVQCGAFDDSLKTQGITRARAYAAIDQALERSRSASKDRERGQASLFGLFSKAEPEKPRLEGYPVCEPWDLRETLVREKQSLGFYVSGHPLDRYGLDLSRLGVVPAGSLGSLPPWTKVRVGGMVEGYREKIFKGGGGKLAFFILEDTNGRIEVKVRQNQIETYAHVLTAGEPVLISGKLSFPQQEEGEESEGPREPTLLLDMAESLSDAIRLETKHVAIHVSERRADRDHLSRLARVLAESPGACPVQLFIRFEDGNEAVLALPRYRVEPNDGMLARLEKLFGEKVAELR
ncbi:MAG: OB-fold nucleic acid binding domain-containing protein, partial [Byssovorax sp.]